MIQLAQRSKLCRLNVSAFIDRQTICVTAVEAQHARQRGNFHLAQLLNAVFIGEGIPISLLPIAAIRSDEFLCQIAVIGDDFNAQATEQKQPSEIDIHKPQHIARFDAGQLRMGGIGGAACLIERKTFFRRQLPIKDIVFGRKESVGRHGFPLDYSLAKRVVLYSSRFEFGMNSARMFQNLSLHSNC
jgi:hypothetical protein